MTKTKLLLAASSACALLALPAQGRTALIDFGSASGLVTSSGGLTYNAPDFNSTTDTTGAVALNDTNLIPTGWSINVTRTSAATSDAGFSGAGATYGGALPAAISGYDPDTTRDNIFFNAGDQPAGQLTVTLSGLDNTKSYGLLFYGSRASLGGTQTWQLTTGTGTAADVQHLSSGNSTTVVDWKDITPVGGVIAFTATVTGGVGALNFGEVVEVTPVPPSTEPSILIVDDFSDGNIGTATSLGEVSGGFSLQGAGTASETGTIGTMTTSGGASSASSLTAINSLDLGGLPGFTVTFVVDSVVGTPRWNGMFLGLTTMASGDYRGGGNFGFNLYSDNAGTIGGVKLMSQDGPSNTRTTVEEVIPAGGYTLADLQNGFTASFTVLPDKTYSYSITGLGPDVSGSGTLLSTSYPLEFSSADYVVAGVQQDASPVAVNLDNVTVTSTYSDAAVMGALAALKNHILGTAVLTGPEIAADKATVDSHQHFFGFDSDVMAAAFDLVETYDTQVGPLWGAGSPVQILDRSTDSDENIDWVVYHVMQTLMDRTYTSANLVAHAALLDGKLFGSSSDFPGAVAPPAVATHTATINASYPDTFGWQRFQDDLPARKPTGTYVAPGTIVTVTVPPAIVNKGYKLRVGAHSWDLSVRPTVKRLDRSTILYDINSTQIQVGSPIGGGIYIEVPYLANEGVVNIDITGAVRSPFFSSNSVTGHVTTLSEWQNTERHHPAPWADFQTEKFMMQVPTNWIYNFNDPVTLMANWDQAIDTMNDLTGFPHDRGKETMYIQVDVDLRGDSYFPGYPTGNDTYNPKANYNGLANNYLLQGPQFAPSFVFHEQGHSYLIKKFDGETESHVNLLHVAVWNQAFGIDLDTAFTASRGEDIPFRTLDNAAITWMTSFNFSPKEVPMAETEKRYQLKGHAKFVDIGRLFGWQVVADYHYGMVADGIASTDTTEDDDDLIVRLAVATGVDIRPLLHFWGIVPADSTAVANAIATAGLPVSNEVYDQLWYYRSLVPANNAAFQSFATGWWEGPPSINGFQTESGHARQWDSTDLSGSTTWSPGLLLPNGEIYDESSHARIVARVDEVLALYFPGGDPVPNVPPVVDAGADQSIDLDPALGGGDPVAGAHFEWDAAQDPAGDGIWGSTTANTYDWGFDAGNLSPVVVSDARFDTLTQAYEFPAAKDSDSEDFQTMVPGGDAQPATFEFVLDVDAADGVIFETGGNGDGFAVDVSGGVLRAMVEEDPTDVVASYTLTAEDLGRFIHVVCVVDNVNDVLQLYVDGVLKDAQPWTLGEDWSGTDNGGLGAKFNSIVDGGSTVDFTGRIALMRYYKNQAFGAAEVAANFASLFSSPMAVATLAGSAVDPDGGGSLTTTWTKISGPGGVVFGDSSAVDSTAMFTVAGSYVLQLTADDTFAVASDEVTITVNPVGGNNVPVASDDSVTTAEDTGVAVTLVATDVDPGDTLSYVVVTPPVNGSLSGTPPSLTYTPGPDFNGLDSFTFKANDGTVDSNIATINITVNAVNDAPVANADSAITNEDTGVAITLAATDVDSGSLNYTVVTQPANGTLSGAAPNLTYAPNADFNGADSFTFKANDGTVDSNIATISITVNAVNDAPVVDAGVDQTVTLDVGTPWTPAQIAPAVWFDASDATTITETGGAVSQWSDKSGNARHAVAVAGKEPLTGASTLNGLNVLAFTQDQLDFPALSATDGEWSFIGVVNLTETSPVSADGLLSHSGGATTGSIQVDYRSQSGAFGLVLHDDAGVSLGAHEAGYYETPYATGSKLIGSVFSATDTRSYGGGSLTSTYSAQPVLTRRDDSMRLGVNRGGANFLDADHAEWILFDSAISDADREKLEGYLAHKWGLAANLPAGHPYKSSPPVGSGAVATLDGTVSDVDAGDAVSTTWTTLSGPGAVVFGDVTAVDTTATFDTAGTYVLRLTADDGTVQTSDEVTITVVSATSTVPDVTGQSQVTAQSNILASNLTAGNVTEGYSDSVPAGSVISQSPVGGAIVASGSAVDLVLSLGPESVNNHAIGDFPVLGTVSGTYANLQASDNTYQAITEIESDGNPVKRRYSYLEHKWEFDVTAGESVTFHVEAHHTANSESDEFVFAYSTTGENGAYQTMVMVTKTSDDNTTQSFTMPSGIAGTVHVRVTDTNRGAGNRALDTVYVDRIYFLTSNLAQAAQALSGYEMWAADYEGADIANPAVDSDGDGLNNGEERVWGLDPTNGASSRPIHTHLDPQTGAFRYGRLDRARTLLNYTVWTSTDLVTWTEDEGAAQTPGLPDPMGIQTVDVTLSPELLANPSLFVQVRAAE